jgi:hypothetical protein
MNVRDAGFAPISNPVNIVLLAIRCPECGKVVRYAKIRDTDVPVVSKYDWRWINNCAVAKVGKHTLDIEWLCNHHALANL